MAIANSNLETIMMRFDGYEGMRVMWVYRFLRVLRVKI